MTFEQLCILLVVGALAGWLAGLILAHGRFGFVANLIIGVTGSFLGRYILGVIGFYATTTLATLLTAVGGAVLLLWLLSLLPGGRTRKK
jgi:uncharacterized membrane protein YeaQ/YmgE (transglycosylase-associated protein family)